MLLMPAPELGLRRRPPVFAMSDSVTNQVFADGSACLAIGYRLPKALDENVSSLHSPALVALTTLRKDQACYIGVKVEGPVKLDTYRY